jgi:tetratricopeptide (TPR) repeat protein
LKELLEGRDDATLERVAQQASGNPFLIEELARAVDQGRTGLTETVLATAQARLEALSPSARRVLRAAAVLGNDLSHDGLAALLVDLDEQERSARVAELVAEEILEADTTEHGRLRFRQVLLREAAYASLTAADEKLAHSLAAKWLASRGADPTTLATHYERAENASAACKYYVAAADQLLEGSDIEGALERIARAEAAGATGETLGKLLYLRAEAHRWYGETQAVFECSTQAAKHLPESSSLWLLAKVTAAIAATALGDLGPMPAIAMLLCVLIEGGASEGKVLVAAARIAAQLSRYRAAPETERRLFGLLSTAVKSCKDERAVGIVLAALATDASHRDELEAAIDLGTRAHEHSMRSGDVRTTGTTLANHAYTLMLVGQYGRAETALREVLTLAERASIRGQESLAKHNLGPTVAHNGDLAAGEAFERAAIAMYEEQRDKRMLAASRYYLGRMLIARNNAKEALEEMDRACEAIAETPAMIALTLAGRAFALLALGRIPEALGAAERAVEILEEHGGRVEEPRTVKLALAETLLASGQSPRAMKIISSLAMELLERANRLRDPELRRSFLHDVEDHARIFALHKGLAQTE